MRPSLARCSAGLAGEQGSAAGTSAQGLGNWDTLEASRDDPGFVTFDGGNYSWSPVSLLDPSAEQVTHQGGVLHARFDICH